MALVRYQIPPSQTECLFRTAIDVVQVILNIVSGMTLVWFGPIANSGASAFVLSARELAR